MSERRVRHPGGEIAYTVKRSARRRSIGLRIDAGGLSVALPAHASLADADRAVLGRLDWILKHLARRPAPVAALADGASIGWFGKPMRIVAGAKRTALVDGALHVAGHDATLAPALTRFLQRTARAYFAERVPLWSERMGLQPSQLRLTSAGTRWGSCTAAGAVRLNWRLVQAPFDVIDYVIIHELAHLAELNHSPRFWAIVAQHCPAWKAQRDWLKQHGHGLLGW
ncbi:M48 family metallopeptidase [Jeongeupia naejangsanensis]|uniref:M48 family metallopeptidase n=1 Tax=Jeongeupia naejangsanensis TaxID=613195 RepID=A0ABS2BK68_9NEIS|nr:SprT family zinc-dependent metalloprotease [Jeongeupia naejangsanensis]MBM3116012.1 M48 family metallopeptidase [Jeongeupia naejangsanensis]